VSEIFVLIITLLYLLCQFRNSFFHWAQKCLNSTLLGLFNYVVSTAEFVTDLYERTDMHCETGRYVRGHSTEGTTGEKGEHLG
jgi:hypothetical protein